MAPETEFAPPGLQPIQAYYHDYFRAHDNTGPRTLEDFKRFIRTQGAAVASQRNITLEELDQLFVSPRDQQPLVVVLGLRLADERNGPQVLAYERQGRGDKQFLAFVNGRIEEADPNRVAQLKLRTE